MLRRSFLTMPAAFAAPSGGSSRLHALGIDWTVPIASDWDVTSEYGEEVLLLTVPRGQEANPRRPFQYALAETGPLGQFTLQVDVRRQAVKSGGLILVYSWKTPNQFDYLHLCEDDPGVQPVHSGVFHVFNGDRSRISPIEGQGMLKTEGWHSVKMTFDAQTGLLAAWVDGATNPSLRAADLALGAGKIGIGSFFHTAAFRRFKLSRG